MFASRFCLLDLLLTMYAERRTGLLVIGQLVIGQQAAIGKSEHDWQLVYWCSHVHAQVHCDHTGNAKWVESQWCT